MRQDASNKVASNSNRTGENTEMMSSFDKKEKGTGNGQRDERSGGKGNALREEGFGGKENGQRVEGGGGNGREQGRRTQSSEEFAKAAISRVCVCVDRGCVCGLRMDRCRA